MTKYKILVVDDEESLCEILQFNLEVEGYEVDVAYSAEQALDMHPERYSLILLDVMMPRKNGYEVCQEIRAEPALQGTRILMLTAKGRETEVSKGMAMGADAYMTKPFSTKELVAKVKSLLELPA